MEPAKRIELVTYKEKEIILFNYVGLRGEEALEQMKTNTQYVLDYQGEVLTLSDFTDTFMTDEIMEFLKSDASKAAGQKAKKKAILGMSPLKIIFMNIYNAVTGANTKAFDNAEDAKEFLVS